jgi:hypothetical protein
MGNGIHSYCRKNPNIADKIKNDKLKKVCVGLHDLIDGEYSPIRINTICSEVPFYLPVERPDFALDVTETGEIKYFALRGIIDRVDKLNDDTIEIVDYKTGTRVNYNSKERAKKDEESLRKEIQPRIYHAAARQLFPWAKNIIVTFIYLVDGGPISMPFCSDNDIDETIDMVKRRFKTIKANDSPQRNISWKCKTMCSFGKTGQCETLWKEKNEVGTEFFTNKYTLLNIGKKRR